MKRCKWAEIDDLYRQYHDFEWGFPKLNDSELFEYLVLESAQAGLSWHTILKKRENYRKAYDNFDIEIVASYTDKKVCELLRNKGIVRNKKKIEASINNAQKMLDIIDEAGSFAFFIWKFVDFKPIVNCWESEENIPIYTDKALQISEEMKKRAFKFIGPTIIYSYMQAIGMVNDHVQSCDVYHKVNRDIEDAKDKLIRLKETKI